tara:strand:- start:665 stop:1828 length:1164 start_codon:yes stop_codon:yes gene_type:complete
MPTGPHRFGCGEIATGFKGSGFPPGFFNPRRVIPGGGKGRNPGGGNGGGGGDNPYKCVKKGDTCEKVYGNTKRCPKQGRHPCIQTVKCEEQAKGTCEPGVDPGCYASKKECDADIGVVTECKEYDDCQPFQDERWYCATQEIPCTGKDVLPNSYQYKRKCVKCSVKGKTCGTHPTHKTEAECKKVCKSIGCPVFTQGPPMTGLPYSCVETNDTIPCDVPGTTGGGFSVKKVKCLPCNCIIKAGKRFCRPAGPPAGNNPNPCPPNSTKVSCDADCKPKDCPEKYTKHTCYEYDRELCNLKEGKDPLKFKVINKCQSCSCFFNPNTSSEECYRQAIMPLPAGGKAPQGPHNIKDDCPLSTCDDTNSCPDIDCPPGTSTTATTTSLLTEF